MDQPDGRLISIFKTADPGLLPLATMALEAEGIEYTIRNAGKADTLEWLMSQQPTSRPLFVEILVTSDAASRARDLVVDLETASPGISPADPAAILESSDPPTVRLEDAATGLPLGAITEAQLQELSSHLEEDAPQQYFLDGPTIDMLESANADAALVTLLRQALRGRDELTVKWKV